MTQPEQHTTSLPLPKLLAQIDQEWLRHGAAIADLATPGLDTGEIVAKLKSVGLTATNEVLTWFQWHNGIAAPGRLNRDVGMVPCWELLSLDEAIANTEMLREIAGGEEEFWPSTWLWLLSNIGGGCIAVDTGSPCSTTYRRGRDDGVAEAERWGRFASLSHWAEALLAHLRSPDLHWRRFDPQGSVDGAWDLPEGASYW